MNSRSLSQLAIVLFFIAGVVGVGLRHSVRQSEKTALEDSLWRVTYNVSFKAQADETTLRLALPSEGEHVSIEREEFDVKTLQSRTRSLRPSGTRELVVQTRQLGDYQVSAASVIRLRPGGGGAEPPLQNLSGDVRARYLRDERTTMPVRSPRVRELLQRAQSETSTEEELLQWLFDFCSRELAAAPSNFDDNPLGTLTNKKATPLGRARLLATLCRASGFPARLVTGLELRQQANARPHTWVEVFRDSHWWPFDPEYGYARHMPINFVATRRDGEAIVETPPAAQAEELESSFSIVRLGPPESVLRSERRRPLQIFDLTRLPIEMHEVLTLLLLLPFGALITALFRNVIGLRTFGTFAPVLFAVSFIYADWGTGLVVLGVVLVAGLVGRALVERLRLLMVPRLSILLTIIVLCVVFGVSALDYLELTPSAKAVLLPLVILTILIERFYVSTEEDGLGNAFKLGVGTVVVSACCYLVLGWGAVGQWVLVYPETHLITIALFIMIGRYAGYRLVELWRFRDLVRLTPPAAD